MSPMRSPAPTRVASTCSCSIRWTARPTSTSTSRSAPSSRSCAAPRESTEPTSADFLQPGTRQVCAGYAIYGPATMLVLTFGRGVHGFTLDRDAGEFVLTHPDHARSRPTRRSSPSTPPTSASGSRRCAATSRNAWPAATAPRGKDFNMRWIASLVAEVHRILMRGGLFMYPRDTKDPAKPGRLRLLYEANPIAMIVEQAGGARQHRAPAHAGCATAGAAPARAGDLRFARRGRAHRALSSRARRRRRPAVSVAAVQHPLAVHGRGSEQRAARVSQPSSRGASHVHQASDHRGHRLVGRRHHLGHAHLRVDLHAARRSRPPSSRATPSTATTAPR